MYLLNDSSACVSLLAVCPSATVEAKTMNRQGTKPLWNGRIIGTLQRLLAYIPRFQSICHFQATFQFLAATHEINPCHVSCQSTKQRSTMSQAKGRGVGTPSHSI